MSTFFSPNGSSIWEKTIMKKWFIKPSWTRKIYFKEYESVSFSISSTDWVCTKWLRNTKRKEARTCPQEAFSLAGETRQNLKLYKSTKRGNLFLGNGEIFSKKMANELDSIDGQTLGNIWAEKPICAVISTKFIFCLCFYE